LRERRGEKKKKRSAKRGKKGHSPERLSRKGREGKKSNHPAHVIQGGEEKKRANPRRTRGEF